MHYVLLSQKATERLMGGMSYIINQFACHFLYVSHMLYEMRITHLYGTGTLLYQDQERQDG